MLPFRKDSPHTPRMPLFHAPFLRVKQTYTYSLRKQKAQFQSPKMYFFFSPFKHILRPNSQTNGRVFSKNQPQISSASILYQYCSQNETSLIWIREQYCSFSSQVNFRYKNLMFKSFPGVSNFYPVRIILHNKEKIMFCAHSYDNRLTTSISAEFCSL